MTDKEYGAPVTIGDNCWIAGNVTILAGASIGEGCVIGAGSVVAGKIPANSLAYGNPCKVVRQITENDAIDLKKNFFKLKRRFEKFSNRRFCLYFPKNAVIIKL